MKHVDMRKLPAAAQEERRRQVIGLRQAGMIPFLSHAVLFYELQAFGLYRCQTVGNG